MGAACFDGDAEGREARGAHHVELLVRERHPVRSAAPGLGLGLGLANPSPNLTLTLNLTKGEPKTVKETSDFASVRGSRVLRVTQRPSRSHL